MTPTGDHDVWTAPRLGARLAALKGLAPVPACYVVWRATSQGQKPESAGYELPGQSGRFDEATFEQWLVAQGLAGAERLSVSVLVIRETLDASGLLVDGVLERRRGGSDGPYYGNVARVEFAGAAKQVRRFRALRDGRLAALPPDDGTGTAPPADDLDTESFAGDDAAIRAFLGSGAVILNRRAPTLSEDLLGLSAIVHARRANGTELACGVGWHGTTAYVLTGDFPRHDRPLMPPPELDAAVASMPDLIRHETRFDDQGFCVIAQRRGRQTLVSVRLDGSTPRIEPYLPGRIATANEDQRRWMVYAETFEARTVIDSWRTADGGDIVVLTIDQDQEAWRHVIDPDGVEVSRHAGNEDAAAVLHRARAAAVPETSGATSAASSDVIQADYQAPADSLFAKVRAYLRVTALLRAATEAEPSAALDTLRELAAPLHQLNAHFSAGSLHRLIQDLEPDAMPPEDFSSALNDLVTRLRDEMALTRIVLLPAARTSHEPPFGTAVEVRFPLAAYDIEEAVHCLALRRTTAAVLHAMRVMRHGLQAVETLLDTPALTDLTWSRAIAAVRSAARAHPDLTRDLDRVRRAWKRPGLMPADKYTEEEAEAVLEAVASFMRTLAGCFDADGAP